MSKELVLVGINAQYIHTALAVRQLAAVLRQQGRSCTVVEYTINQRPGEILEDLALRNAGGYLFSCYIWNIQLVQQVAEDLARVRPGAFLLAGGPQVAHRAEAFLAEAPGFFGVSTGEGESGITALFDGVTGSTSWGDCPGLVWRSGPNTVESNAKAPLPEMDSLPFAYSDLDEIGTRIVYYESMRGCPYQCSYCLSGRGEGVRYKSLERVFIELGQFLDARLKQVKFVDRTFNCNAKRALAIWRYLAQHDNGVTNFHFEMAGHLFTQEAIQFLATVRPGLFQFELGVQSTHPDTLRAIHREKGLESCFANARRLNQAGNVHLHLDLIAGLPYEDYHTFANSFNDVYAARPHQLQLGFLKVLSGSEMEQRAHEYGLVYQQGAPFEILYNRWLSFEEIRRLKGIADMVELYYNSGRFSHMTEHLCRQWDTPFEFFSDLSEFYKRRVNPGSVLGKRGQYGLLGDFAAASEKVGPDNRLQWLCRLDTALHEKPHVLPPWVAVDGSRPYREAVLAFYSEAENIACYLPQYADRDPKQILKMAHVEVLPFDPFTGQKGPCALLFDYTRRDITGQALCRRIPIQGI